ncbi:hypothetical protein ACS0TY_003205 [Phlomoides rotata]
MIGKQYSRKSFVPAFDLKEIEEGLEGYDELEKSSLMSQKNFDKRFGMSPNFIASTLTEEGGLPEGSNPASLMKEAIHVISSGYEGKTEWGDGGLCTVPRVCFKGSAPINLCDMLHQVLRWALGSVEIFHSRHCTLWYGFGGKLKWLERLAYIKTIVYPFTYIALLAYCTLPTVCLLTGKFIIPILNNLASIWFVTLIFLSIIATVFQGLLKVLAGVDTSFTVTKKPVNDAEFGEFYLFKWTTLLIPPTTLIDA